MAYDELLAERLRRALPGITEKKMFGGLAFFIDGNMFVGVAGHDLMVRVGPQAYADALARPHARAMDITGKPMKGYVMVAPPGHADATDLATWIELARSFAATLPAR